MRIGRAGLASRSSSQLAPYSDHRHGGSSTTKARTATVLNYRNGDADESTRRRRQHSAAASSLTSASTQDVSVRKYSHYSHSNSDENANKNTDPNTPSKNSLWSAVFRPRRRITCSQGHTETEQFVLDEYLEFIDKRYKRMHENDRAASGSNKKSSSGTSARSKGPAASSSSTSNASGTSKSTDDNGVNTAWNWLMKDQPSSGAGSPLSSSSKDCDVHCQKQREADALEVLGLAGLASAELLRKHHLPVPQEPSENTSNGKKVMEAKVIDVPPSGGRAAASAIVRTPSTVLAALATTVQALKLRQERRLAIVALTLRAALYQFVTKSMAFASTVASRAGPTLVRMAGGKRTLKMTATVALMTFYFLVKPLGAVVLKGAQNS